VHKYNFYAFSDLNKKPGTIGYIELVYALENKIPFALIKNKSGQFVKADLASVTSAAAGSSKDMVKAEYKLSITDSASKGAYPISSFTWMLVFKEMGKEKGVDIVKFAKWAMSDVAQKKAKEINYAEVPTDLRKEVLKSLEQVKVQ
jgi:phosphate transport system substrate-binding protein